MVSAFLHLLSPNTTWHALYFWRGPVPSRVLKYKFLCITFHFLRLKTAVQPSILVLCELSLSLVDTISPHPYNEHFLFVGFIIISRAAQSTALEALGLPSFSSCITFHCCTLCQCLLEYDNSRSCVQCLPRHYDYCWSQTASHSLCHFY